MYRYLLYGLKLETDIEFRQLVTDATGGEPQIAVAADEIPAEIRERTDVKYEFDREYSWLSNRTCWIIAEKGSRIKYQLKEGGRMDYLRNYLLGWGMSMLALQRGILAMHCSAVADERGAVLICGESGAGKSTLTVSLLERGFRLMADDMAFVECTGGDCAMVSPAFPYQKLCRDAALERGYRLEELYYVDEDKDKFLVPYRGKFELNAVPVSGVLMLGLVSGEKILSGEITGVDRFRLVANNLFLRHLLGQQKYEPWIGQMCLGMAAAVPAAYLGRPLRGETTGQMAAKAMELIERWSDKQIVFP